MARKFRRFRKGKFREPQPDDEGVHDNLSRILRSPYVIQSLARYGPMEWALARPDTAGNLRERLEAMHRWKGQTAKVRLRSYRRRKTGPPTLVSTSVLSYT